MTEPPEQLRLWTFYNPNDGPMILELDGHDFTCERVEVESLPPDEEILNYYQTIQTSNWRVRVTFEFDFNSKKNSDDVIYQIQAVPNRVSL